MSVREILEIPQNESINLLIDNAVRVGGAEPTGTIQIDANGLYNVAPYAAANVNVPEPSGSISITENGTVDVKNYASANVNVPQGVFPTGSLSITENGTYDVTNYAGANVNVPGIVPTGTISITENGTVDVTEYASAAVNVPSDIPLNCEIVDITVNADTRSLSFSYSGNTPITFYIDISYNTYINNSISSFYYRELIGRNQYNVVGTRSVNELDYAMSQTQLSVTIDRENKNITCAFVEGQQTSIYFRTGYTYKAYLFS